MSSRAQIVGAMLERVVTLLLIYFAAHGAARAYGAVAAINVVGLMLLVLVAIRHRIWLPPPPSPELRAMTLEEIELERERVIAKAATRLGDTPDRVRAAIDAFGAVAHEEDGRPWTYASPRAAPPSS